MSCGAGDAERWRAQGLKETGGRGQDRAPGLAAGADRAGRRPRPGQRPHRRGPAHQRGHGPQVAGPVRRPRPGRAQGPAPERAAELVTQGLASQISPSSVLRILAEHPIKPWQYQSWIFPRDPDFAAKATVILDLYQGYYQGKRLDRKSTRLNSSHVSISYAVFCLKKKKKNYRLSYITKKKTNNQKRI